jgi:phosphoribosylglycinamide formyltransferase 1
MINVAVFASGEGSNAENLFKYFAGDTRIRFKLVVTNNDEAGIVAKAEHYKKNIHIISKTALENYTEQIIEFLKLESIDMIVLAGFLLKIPEAMVRAFPNKIINIHPALLPKFGGKGMYGMHVHRAVIAAGEKESGITIHFVDEEYDHGAYILQAKCDVQADDTAETLRKKIANLEMEFFPKAIEIFLENLP